MYPGSGYKNRALIVAARDLGSRIERSIQEITDEQVQDALNRIQEQNGVWKPEEEGKAEDGNFVSVKLLRLDETDAEMRDYEFVLGKGDAIPDIEAAIKKLDVGSENDFEISFPKNFDEDFAVSRAAVHCFDLTNFVPPDMRQVDDERGVCGLRYIGVLFGSCDQDREVRAVCVGDEPFMAVDHPLIAILVSTGLNQRWIRTGDVWFSHGETRGCSPFAEGFQIFVELFLSAPVQKRVLVAFIWRLTVQHPRSVM